MNLKFSEEFKNKVRYFRSKGYTHQEISDILHIPKRQITYILTYNRYKLEGLPACPFCNSTKTKISSMRNYNPGKEGEMYYVVCNNCHARGPRVIRLDTDDRDPEIFKLEATRLWRGHISR